MTKEDAGDVVHLVMLFALTEGNIRDVALDLSERFPEVDWREVLQEPHIEEDITGGIKAIEILRSELDRAAILRSEIDRAAKLRRSELDRR